MKELWIRLDSSIPSHQKDGLLKAAAKVCDALLVDAKDLENAKKTGVKTAADSDKSDIQVLEAFSDNIIARLKSTCRPVAVKVIVKGKEDEEKAIIPHLLNIDLGSLDSPRF